MKLKNILFLISVAFLPLRISAQAHQGPADFPELIMTDIPGSPKLSKPVLVTGSEEPVISEGNGLAAPTFYDWDGDGLKDLLIGEFGSGVENGRYVGNFIRVYKNSGTGSQPSFTGRFDYARHPFKMPDNGTPYSVDQFCCIGFTPQFTDLNNDGLKDLITGQYYGEVSWFQGSESGFMPGEFLQQEFPEVGGPRNEPNKKLPRKEHQFYWLYSSASFGDFTNDGKVDLVTGGIMAIRLSENIGAPTKPRFAQRELLLDINNNPLKLYDYNEEELKYYESLKFLGYVPPIAGDDHLSPYVVDWDHDGMLDLLVTNSYIHEGLATVDFFKGVQTKEGYRFHPVVPLFTVKNKGKAFPGSGPRIAVTDWNNDGVNDLLIGVSVIMMNGEFNDYLSWNWEKDHGVMKDPPANLSESDLQRYKESVTLPEGITIEDYMTIRHQGYVYVMLGSNEETNSVKVEKTER